MEFVDKQRLRKNHTALLQDLDVRDVLPQLFQDGVITERDRDEINGEVSREAKAEKVLNLLYRGGPRSFQSFLTALQRIPRYQHLADALGEAPDDTMVKHLTDPWANKSEPLDVQPSQTTLVVGQDHGEVMVQVQTPDDRGVERASLTVTGSIKACGSMLLKAPSRVPSGDNSLWTFLSVCITNIHKLLIFILFGRDLFHIFCLIVFGHKCALCFTSEVSWLFCHIMLLLPLGKFFYCKQPVKYQFELSKEAINMNENEKGYKERLTRINNERLSLKKTISQAVKLILITEYLTCVIVVVLLVFTDVSLTDFDDRLFMVICVSFLVDLVYKTALYVRVYYPEGVLCIDKRFGLKKKAEA